MECVDMSENNSPVSHVRKLSMTPSSRLDPFGMGTRHADEVASLAEERQNACQLGFLAAHDIRCIGLSLREAGQNAHVAPRRRRCHRAGEDCLDAGRHGHVGCLDPALAGSGHAADDHAKIGSRSGVGQIALQDRGKSFAAGDEHAFGAAPFGKNRTFGVKQPEPEARGAPIDGCKRGFAQK